MHSTLRTGVAVAALALTPAAEAAAAAYGSRTLGQGTTGSDVKRLQRYLDRAGYETAADGIFGPATARSVRGFESAEERSPDGTATRYEQHLVRVRATQAPGEEEQDPPAEDPAAEEAYLDDSGLAVAPASAPEEVKAIIAAGNEIASAPYKYGGGHTKRWRDSGYDCSGSMSYALHGADLLDSPLDSTGFMSWGEPGPGTWVTTYANAGHSYMVVAGLRFDTTARRQTGNRWSDEMRSARGYRVRHPEGL
jgi:peptidoglycan hydrolase-like protein with peptidoglycan-binding domain